MKLAGRVAACPDDEVDRQKRSEIADGSSQRSKNAELGAIVAILRIEGVADETAVTGLAPKQSNLSLELYCSS